MLAEETVSLRINPELEYTQNGLPTLRKEVRSLLAQLGNDVDKPLTGVVRPGDTVLLKPNLVYDRVTDARSALTNGAVVRVVCDLVLEALNGTGKVIIADVPLQGAQFDAVVRLSGVAEVMEHYRRVGADVELLDLRQEYLVLADGMHRGLRKLKGDPLGYVVVNLGESSELEPLGSDRVRFAVGDYDRDSTQRYHMSSSRNEYLIPKTVLSADVLINLPKFKTHKKAGITCALKNLVGICGHKSYLPHYREGAPNKGGDEFAVNHPIKELQRDTIDRLKASNATLYKTVRAIGRVLLRLAMAREKEDLRKVMSGSWHGNDTLWRTILDLNKIAVYADKEGILRDTPQRRYLCIVDGICGGEGDGPLQSTSRNDGVLLAGVNPVLVDLVVCLLMGIDPEAVRQVRRAFEIESLPLVKTPYDRCRAGLDSIVKSNVWPLPVLGYSLPPAWEGYVRRFERVSGTSRARR